MIRFFRKEDLELRANGHRTSQPVELFIPESGEVYKSVCLEILPTVDGFQRPSDSLGGIQPFRATIVDCGVRGEVVEGIYASHELIGCFDIFPLRADPEPKLAKLVYAQRYLIPG